MEGVMNLGVLPVQGGRVRNLLFGRQWGGRGWVWNGTIFNFIMQMNPREINEECGQCCKKQKLIEKYLNLIDLLKKKSDKSQLSTTLKRSIDAPQQTSSSLPSFRTLPRSHLAYSLHILVLKRQIETFNHIQQVNLENRCHKGFLFVQTIEKIINRKMMQNARRLFLQNSTCLGAGIRENILTEQEKKVHLFDKSVSRNQSYCSLSLFLEGEKREKLKNVTKRVFELTQELTLLKHQKKVSDQQIEENLRRQEVQSKKKKESLEMLAEEMAEKNDVINELQAALKFYQAKQGKIQNNVLEEDSLTMKREIEKMEKLNEKLSLELERKTEHLQKTEEELTALKEKITKIEAEYSELKQKNFQMGIELQNLEKKKQQYNSLSLFLEKKLTNLKKYEKLISNNLKVIDQASLIDKSSFNSTTLKPKNSRLVLQDPITSENNLEDKQNNKDFSPITKFQNQYKIEKILNYLYNIELEDVWINNEEKLFDHEELNVLNDVKFKFMQLNEELKKIKNKNVKNQPIVEVIRNSPARLSKQCGESDEIYFHEQHVSGSIFDVFTSEKVHKDKEAQKCVSQFQPKPQCLNCQNRQEQSGEVTSRRADQGFTIKLLQMQIEKNKQVQKISEVKSKLFHIRSIVMNLIKSLEMKTLRPQSRDIIDVCFEFFEYSEEEKQIIFHTQQQKKEKKFLGFF